MRTVSVIGHGEIGSALVRGIADLEAWQLGRVLTRRPVRDLAGQTQDVEVFLAHPSDLIIDAAGPDALRVLGPRALASAPVWSVGAVAMAEPVFQARIASVSKRSGHHLRLFACGMANMPLTARRLRIAMRAPEIETSWTGPLSQAVAKWPDRLNTAVAAALTGPGLAATMLSMQAAGADAPHEIEIEAEGDGITWQRTIRFAMTSEGPHPVAQMLLTELARADRYWQGV